jgi:hypothetical protein
MEQSNLFSIFFSLILLFLIPNLATAMIEEEATKIPYQVSNTDRIIIGTVSGIDVYYDYTIYTITVKEWLYNPLSTETIKVRSEIGTNVAVEDEVELAQNESALLMLKDENIDTQLFRVPLGLKYPVSDRDAVIEELKAQGKLPEENKTVNKTNETEEVRNQTFNKINNTEENESIETEDQQEENPNNTQKQATTPFISPVWGLAALLGAIMYVRRKK